MTMEYQYNDFPIPTLKCNGLLLCSILKEVKFSSFCRDIDDKDQYRIGVWLCHLWKTKFGLKSNSVCMLLVMFSWQTENPHWRVGITK